jgi:hypothetical protein
MTAGDALYATGLEAVIDDGLGSLGGEASAPVRFADPVANLGAAVIWRKHVTGDAG